MWLCDVAEKNTPKTLNLRQIMKAQNNNSVQDQDGNSTKPLLPAVYLMKLHETITIAEDVLATRVPGGWIYEFQKPQVNILEIVFVPFNNEFQK